MQTEPGRRLRRNEASKYLKDEWGIERAPSTLAKLATIGGGPDFEKAGRVPLYKPETLDRWARSILSPPKPTGGPSQSEMAAATA